MCFDERVCRIALTMIPGIGPVISRKLISHLGSAEAVFREKKKNLQAITGISPNISKLIERKESFRKAEEELLLMEKHDISMLFFLDKEYPSRLKHCYDAPPVLYVKGTTDLNVSRVISVIGTRKISPYGTEITEKLIQELSHYDVMVISGLAYGVDVTAHKTCIENDVPTVGVLGHGLDIVYPAAHRNIARKMTETGALISDFPCNTRPDKENFPQRNRIVAGMSDAIVVVESGESGGSMITAEFGIHYNRDVFAFPGRINDPYSAGCLSLIRKNKAALITCCDDLVENMGWHKKTPKAIPQPMAEILSDEENKIMDTLRGQGNVHIDEISFHSSLSSQKVSALLLNLEFQGHVRSLPGKFYRIA